MQPQKRELRNFILGGKDVFGAWLGGLKDAAGRDAIHKRLDRVEDGNFGDRQSSCFFAGETRERNGEISEERKNCGTRT